MKKKAIVIGAGIGGLASAIRLASRGYQVHVYEKNSIAGGKLTEFQLGKYRFDFGPSLFTMPDYVEELFTLCDKDPANYFQYRSLSEACRYFYPDGSKFIAPTDKNEFAEAAASTFRVSQEEVSQYFDYNENIFNKSGQIFLTEPVHKLKTFLNRRALNAAAQSYVIELFRSMNKANKGSFSDPKLVQLFNRYATYNGSNPYDAPAILNSISVLEHLHGTYYPKGGMSSISSALYQLSLDIGVKYHFNTLVSKITYEKKEVTGIHTALGGDRADVVISNMDVGFAYEKLLPELKPPAFYMNRSKSSSAIIFYWGIKKKFTELGLHNIFFANNYRAEFTDIFKGEIPHTDPTVYINNTSVYDKGDAPENSSNLFTMINVPASENMDLKKTRKDVIRKLSSQLGEDVEDLIEEERIVTPSVIEEKTLSHKGALYGSDSNNWVNAFLRHPNFSGKLKGLYFVGGSVHPGGGIPLCLLSAKIATELVNE